MKTGLKYPRSKQRMDWWRIAVGAMLVPVLALLGHARGQAASTGVSVIANIDLSKAFATRSNWRFVATQAPDVTDPIYDDQKAPGEVRFCLKKGDGDRCDPALVAMAHSAKVSDSAWEPHELKTAKIVYPRGTTGAPLLLLQTGSLRGGNGDQAINTRFLAYRRASDRFEVIYTFISGRNNNQEVRFIDSGVLTGNVISAEPTDDRPFGYWITVNKLGPDDTYRQVLRYRSATHYGDGNPLAVIDSEMPNIQRHLGLWRPGAPLPLPARTCPKPHLVGTVLWCE